MTTLRSIAITRSVPKMEPFYRTRLRILTCRRASFWNLGSRPLSRLRSRDGPRLCHQMRSGFPYEHRSGADPLDISTDLSTAFIHTSAGLCLQVQACAEEAGCAADDLPEAGYPAAETRGESRPVGGAA